MSAEFCEWLVSWPIILPFCFLFVVFDGGGQRNKVPPTACHSSVTSKVMQANNPPPVLSSTPLSFSLFLVSFPWSGVKIVSLELPKNCNLHRKKIHLYDIFSLPWQASFFIQLWPWHSVHQSVFQPCSAPHSRKSKVYFFIQQLVTSLNVFPWSHRAKPKYFPQTVLDTGTAWAPDLSYGSQKIWFKCCFSPRWTIWYPL